MITFELALNERTRRFLKVEEVFIKYYSQIKGLKPYGEHSCFNTLFDLMNCAGRSDLKIEIIQELDKQIIKYKSPNKTKLKKNLLTLKKLIAAKQKLEKNNIIHVHQLENEKLLQELKAACDSPFGIVSSDLTQFQAWLKQLETNEKKKYFKEKIKPFEPVFNGLKNILSILRASELNHTVSTIQGVKQHVLNPKLKNDLVTLIVTKQNKLCPQISSNKYALNIHFTNPGGSTMVSRPIKFKLGVCSF